MFQIARAFLIAAMILGLSSCGPTRFANNEPIDSSDITLHVENRNFSDATLYAVDGDLRVRVGRVTGKTDRTLTFRWVQEELQMEVRFTGGRRLLSGRHAIVPGAADNLLLIIDISPNVTPLLTGRR